MCQLRIQSGSGNLPEGGAPSVAIPFEAQERHRAVHVPVPQHQACTNPSTLAPQIRQLCLYKSMNFGSKVDEFVNLAVHICQLTRWIRPFTGGWCPIDRNSLRDARAAPRGSHSSSPAFVSLSTLGKNFVKFGVKVDELAKVDEFVNLAVHICQLRSGSGNLPEGCPPSVAIPFETQERHCALHVPVPHY